MEQLCVQDNADLMVRTQICEHLLQFALECQLNVIESFHVL